MCAASGVLPKSLQIDVRYDPTSVPRCRGGFADVWKSEYRGREVAIKVLRIYSDTDLPKMTHVSY